MGHPNDGEITATIDDFWEAVGVDADDVVVSPYRRETKRDIDVCQDLPEGDRWIAFRTAQLPGDLHPQDRLWAQANAHFEEEGFTVRRYRMPLSNGLLLRAKNDELAVYLDVASNGFTDIRVVGGPCGPMMMDGEPPRGSEPID